MLEPPVTLGPAQWKTPPVFVTDYDRTLAQPGAGPDPSAMKAIAALRAAGIRCILATGRPADDLLAQGIDPESFDAFVIEGGALFGPLNSLVYLNIGNELEAAAKQCKAAGIPIAQRSYSFSVPREHEATVRSLVGECSIQPNVDQLDILPPHVDKGTGLDGALGKLGNRALPVLAIGDGENDIPLLDRATYGLAPANAVPALREMADEVLAESGPAAVVAAAERLLRGDWATILNPPTSS